MFGDAHSIAAISLSPDPRKTLKMLSRNDGVELPAMLHCAASPNPVAENNKPHMYFVDWFRTKSVINVVFGHIWMDVTDCTGLDKQHNVQMPPWNESVALNLF